MAREIGDRWFLAIAIADLAHVVLRRAGSTKRRPSCAGSTVPAPSTGG
jgi:hypothetical protein